MTSQSMGREKGEGAASWFPVEIDGRTISPSIKVRWKTNQEGMARLKRAGRLFGAKNSLGYVRARICELPACSRRTKKTRSHLRRLCPGRGNSSAPKAHTMKTGNRSGPLF